MMIMKELKMSMLNYPTVEEMLQHNPDAKRGDNVVVQDVKYLDTVVLSITALGYEYAVLDTNTVTIICRNAFNPDQINRVVVHKESLSLLNGLFV